MSYSNQAKKRTIHQDRPFNKQIDNYFRVPSSAALIMSALAEM